MLLSTLKTASRKAIINIAVLLCLLGVSIMQVHALQSEPYQSLSHQRSSNSNSALRPMMFSQKKQSEWRSRSDVMAEVKRRYDARVLRISLNKQREVYNVRLLMPSGKVRNIQVSARR